MVHFLRQVSGGIPTSFSESHTAGRDQKQRAARVRFTPAPMPLAPAERWRSAARDQGIIHTDRFDRESAASLCSAVSSQ
jgi:hypothetical protein